MIICVTTYWFDGAYEINSPFCERFGREHYDQFNQTIVDQITCPLVIVHNILVKSRPLIFNNHIFLDCDVYWKMTSTYPFMHFFQDY